MQSNKPEAAQGDIRTTAYFCASQNCHQKFKDLW